MNNQNNLALIAENVMVPREKVLTCTMESELRPILQQMDEKNYTHVPILKGDEVCGILSEKTMLTIAATEGSLCNHGRTIKNIENYVSFQQVCLEHFFDYVTPTTSLEIIKNLFAKIEEGKERLDILIVTDNGRVTGKFLGIITPWDII